MRATNRRGRSAAVAPSAFGWDRAVTATLQHVSLPWDETIACEPLQSLGQLGRRDRLSLLAQFMAHEAFLQFTGIADGEFDPSEWTAVRKRGCDVRLVRIAARAADAITAPPLIALAQQFAGFIGADLPILRQAWARPDAIFAEAFIRLSDDTAADLGWVRRAAAGAILSPGPDALRHILAHPCTYSCGGEDVLRAVQRFVSCERSVRLLAIEGVSPLERYSALPESLVDDPAQPPASVAERILARTAGQRHVFVITNRSAFDAASREVIDLLASARHGTWLFPDFGEPLPPTRRFIIAPSLASAARLRENTSLAVDEFVATPAFDAYVRFGDVPESGVALPALTEPVRSYIGALALLGSRIAAPTASAFLREFLFEGSLAELALQGISALEQDTYAFASDSIHEEAKRLVPVTSRPAISRVAAQHAEGVRAALLWLDAGDTRRATAALEEGDWPDPASLVAALRRVPQSLLTPQLLARYAAALVECGRYRDACQLVPGDEYLIARAERRMGDYATSLARLERLESSSFDALLLRAEVLRLLGRDGDAVEVLTRCVPSSPAEQVRLDFERGLHGEAVSLPEDDYLAARLATYRALERSDFAQAAGHALESHARATTLVERIDASLDRLFAVFSAGSWDEARAVAVEALQEVEETQGDRAAGGILFTLAFLAADDGQWAHAGQRIARLRQYYAATGDALRLGEVQLLTAHLDFCRGRFSDARKSAQLVFDGRAHHDQIREAAALILDEIDWVQRIHSDLRSTGTSGNEELRRRHLRLVRCRSGRDPEPESFGVASRLFAFRYALWRGDLAAAQAAARELDIVIEEVRPSHEVELDVFRVATVSEFPFAPQTFDRRWCFATRNRLDQWNVIGSFEPSQSDLAAVQSDAPGWIVCSEREILYFDGCAEWSDVSRETLAALFRIRAENHRLRRLVEQEEIAAEQPRGAIDGIVGQSPALREVETLVNRVSRRDVPVCILGESGTGKELVARAIHRQSARRHKQFTAVNCAALPENLIESELFGHVRGAFTGADRDRPGLIETTDGGTLFLDEIGELPLIAQAKLLRFLQEGEFRRVGDSANRSADVRIVSATNRRLDAAVEQGRFREDLYYRVRGVEVLLPPLRERGGDVLLLALHFLREEHDDHGAGPAMLSADVEGIFTSYSWPGNVRELQNTVRAAHAMAGEARQVEIEHLPERLRKVAPSKSVAGSYQDSVARFKRELIERSLVEAKGNQNRAAALLKISRQALAYQIRELGILVRV